MRVELVELATHLLHDIVEEAVGELLLELLLDPPVGGEVRGVGFVGRAFAVGEESDEATVPVEDNRPRVASIRKLAGLPVAQDGEFNGLLIDAVVIVNASNVLESVDATDGSPCSQPIFDDEQALLTIDVELLRFAHLLVLDDAVDLQETVRGVSVVLAILELRKHYVSVVRDRKVATCKGKKIVS